eukprot:CAMPEP_0206226862 /NCGR_PEP_ID=MMETSP0047_2-20121206/8317_1 /ASSEMBLY_ACC=CAM_ASM_000192 /TAXON_ID=195065 /ORGANISM="Chroomonas mesostigmatica_cf, Strain CCMP1168" /LENGTH=269 /DNA_ID=CAMNT_0053649977 /DNA_START=30 /DNA_END=839 /DNA_ORIENTATION=-
MLSRGSPAVTTWFTTLAVCASGGVRAGLIGPAFVPTLSMRLLTTRGALGARAPTLGAPRPAGRARSLSSRPMPGPRMQDNNKFELSGRVVIIYDEMTFGSGFKKREFVIETDEAYPQLIKFELLKEKGALIEGFQIGDGIIVSFNVKGALWKEKYFVNLVAWRLKPAQTSYNDMHGVTQADIGGYGAPPTQGGGGFAQGGFPSGMTGFDSDMGGGGPPPPPLQGMGAAANQPSHALGNPRQMGTWDGSNALSRGQEPKKDARWDDDIPF